MRSIMSRTPHDSSSSFSSLKMRSIMSRTPHDSSFSFSRRHFQWIIGKVTNGGGGDGEYEELEETLTFTTTTTTNTDSSSYVDEEPVSGSAAEAAGKKKKKTPSSAAASAASAVAKFRSALTAAVTGKVRPTKVTGTLYGHRRGHVHFAFQLDSKPARTVLFELAMPTSTLVKEMASGLVRFALECERKGSSGKNVKLLDETQWRAYCNGRKCGCAARREAGVGDSKVLKAVEPVSMGAGVLPGIDGGDGEGEMMYMRAKFERVVGSRDSEAFYMVNPDGKSGPELSVYLLRV